MPTTDDGELPGRGMSPIYSVTIPSYDQSVRSRRVQQPMSSPSTREQSRRQRQRVMEVEVNFLRRLYCRLPTK